VLLRGASAGGADAQGFSYSANAPGAVSISYGCCNTRLRVL